VAPDKKKSLEQREEGGEIMPARLCDRKGGSKKPSKGKEMMVDRKAKRKLGKVYSKGKEVKKTRRKKKGDKNKK